MTTDSDHEAEKFLGEIKERFPEVSRRINLWLDHLGLEPADRMFTSEMEAFSQATTDAIKSRNEDLATRYLTFMSEKLRSASDKEREYIDVYYVESLLWDVKDKTLLKWGWSLVPENLKVLYVSMWGEPDF